MGLRHRCNHLEVPRCAPCQADFPKRQARDGEVLTSKVPGISHPAETACEPPPVAPLQGRLAGAFPPGGAPSTLSRRDLLGHGIDISHRGLGGQFASCCRFHPLRPRRRRLPDRQHTRYVPPPLMLPGASLQSLVILPRSSFGRFVCGDLGVAMVAASRVSWSGVYQED